MVLAFPTPIYSHSPWLFTTIIDDAHTLSLYPSSSFLLDAEPARSVSTPLAAQPSPTFAFDLHPLFNSPSSFLFSPTIIRSRSSKYDRAHRSLDPLPSAYLVPCRTFKSYRARIMLEYGIQPVFGGTGLSGWGNGSSGRNSEAVGCELEGLRYAELPFRTFMLTNVYSHLLLSAA
ncbi:hypothetical protein NMY22_g1974 [Coprinellus aureogranulatus]|nr:hypothetical protein NMY22_g1974 [Coprinellus aureogranulatus]